MARDILDAFVEARFDRQSAGGKVKARKAASRRMWEAARDALSARNGKSQYVEVDAEIADWLAFNIQELLSNVTPQELADIKRRGKPNDRKAIKDAIRTAVTYYQFLKSQGARDPNKQVRLKFKVSDDVVRDWVNEETEDLWSKYLANTVESQRVKTLLRSVERAKSVYVNFSQSSVAIRNRSKPDS